MLQFHSIDIFDLATRLDSTMPFRVEIGERQSIISRQRLMSFRTGLSNRQLTGVLLGLFKSAALNANCMLPQLSSQFLARVAFHLVLRKRTTVAR